jgi:hypothetical protein
MRQPGNLDEVRYRLLSQSLKHPLQNKPGEAFVYITGSDVNVIPEQPRRYDYG